jgi:hypothetical protein
MLKAFHSQIRLFRQAHSDRLAKLPTRFCWTYRLEFSIYHSLVDHTESPFGSSPRSPPHLAALLFA